VFVFCIPETSFFVRSPVTCRKRIEPPDQGEGDVDGAYVIMANDKKGLDYYP